MRRLLSVSLLMVLAATGCGASYHEKSRAEAAERWANARVGLLVRLAEADYMNGRLESCRQRIKQAFARDSKYPPLYVLAAKLAVEEGELQTARAYLETALSVDPEFSEAHWQMGVLEELAGNDQAAAEQYADALRINPHFTRNILSLATTLVRQDKVAEASQLLLSSSEALPASGRILLALADIHYLQRDYPSAIDAYGQVLRLVPGNETARQGLLLALRGAGRSGEAIDVMKQLDAKGATGDVKLARQLLEADLMADAGQELAKAEKLYQHASAKTSGRSPEIRLGLAKLYFQSRQDAKAIKVLVSLATDYPASGETHAMLGYLYLLSGKGEKSAEAAEHLRLAIATAGEEDRPLLKKLLAMAEER